MGRAKAGHLSNRDIVYTVIKNRLRKGQSLEDISNKQIIEDINKKYDYSINYKTMTSIKTKFKEEFPKDVIPFKRAKSSSPRNTYMQANESEVNRLAKTNLLTYVGSVFRINDENKFVILNSSRE